MDEKPNEQRGDRKPSPPPSPNALRGLLVGVGVALLILFGLFSWGKNRTPSAGTEQRRPGKPSAEVVNVQLVPFSSPAGFDTQHVAIDWKNTGDRPVRTVRANIKAFNSQGEVVYSVSDYTIYAVFDDRPGVAPGETHIKPAGQGFALPPDAGAKAVRATAEITRVEEKGME